MKKITFNLWGKLGISNQAGPGGNAQAIEPSQANSGTEKILFILTACSVGMLMALMVDYGNFIFGSDLGKWTYSQFDTLISFSKWKLGFILVLVGLVIFLGSKLIRFHEKSTLAAVFIATLFIQLLIHTASPVNIGKLVESENATGFYSAALATSPGEILRRFNDPTLDLPGHADWNMPGKILFFQILQAFTTSAQAIAYFIIVFSGLGGLLLYGITRRLFHDPQAGFYALILYMLIPAKLFFFPILNIVTPVWILLCLYLFIGYIEKKKPVFLWLLGVSLFLTILFEPSPLVMGILFVGVLLEALGTRKLQFRDIWKILLHTGLGFLLLYILLYAFFSFDLFGAFLTVLREAAKFNTEYERPYTLWLIVNNFEFIYSAGIPVILIFIYSVLQTVGQWRSLKLNPLAWPMESLYLLCVLASFLFIVLTGVNRGEVTRLWIYLAVFFQVPTALFMTKIPRNTWLFYCVAATLVVQAVAALGKIDFISL